MTFTFEKRVVKDGITVVNKELIDHLQDGILEALNLSSDARAVEAVVDEDNELVTKETVEVETEEYGQPPKVLAPEQMLFEAFKHHCCGGKVVSILGDDFSAMEWTIPTDYQTYYPAQNVLYISQMWWGIVIASLGAKLGINDSMLGSSLIGGNGTVAMADISRIKNLRSNGTPDIIFLFGGANDCATMPVGEFDGTQNYTTADLSKTKWETIADAYKDTVMRLQHFYPKAKIVAMLPTFSTKYTAQKLNEVNTQLMKICDYFGVDAIDLRKCGITQKNVMGMYSGDGLHVNINGMNAIAHYTLKNFNHILDNGENVVYSIRNELYDASSALPNVTGVSKGEMFTTTLVGMTDFSGVAVYMGDNNITSSVLDTTTGCITIESVTDSVIITKTQQSMRRAL